MAGIGKADREHSGHYLSAVAAVAVAVAGMAWFGQNRTLAAAAAALGLYALHLFSIRFLLDNQKRQQRVLDAQWEVLQRFIDTSDEAADDEADLVPAMPIDRESPESVVLEPPEAAAPVADPPEPEPLRAAEDESPVVVGEVVPPAESLGVSGASGSAPEPGSAGETADERSPTDLAIAGGGLVPEDEKPRRPVAEVPVPRHFALGTVALVRDLLSPAEVARVLLEQRRQPGKKFGVLAVEMGLLNEHQREELLLAQQEGLFTDAEMREARQRLREFRENAAHSMAGLD